MYKKPLPTVSIIIPVYNAESTLAACLESIKILGYPKDKFEVIVVDNGSKDGSDKIAQRYGVKLLYETSVQGPSAARNKGIIEAKGELLAFTDADCVVTPGWLKYLTKYWSDTSIGCFAGEIKSYHPTSIVEKYSDRIGMLNQQLTLTNSYLPYTQTANSAYRKEVFNKIGLFNSKMKTGEDGDIAWRMQKELGLTIKYVSQACVFHKHRQTIRGLFKQFYNYELGRLVWKKYYIDYPLPSFKQRFFQLQNTITKAITVFPINCVRYLRKQIDIVDLVSPFLSLVIHLGTFIARLNVREQ